MYSTVDIRILLQLKTQRDISQTCNQSSSRNRIKIFLELYQVVLNACYSLFLNARYSLFLNARYSLTGDTGLCPQIQTFYVL